MILTTTLTTDYQEEDKVVREGVRKAVISSLMCMGLFLACSTREIIQVAGSTTVLPVVSRAADQFMLEHSGVRITVNAGGSGVGINQLGEGTLDIGMSSRDITEAEIRRYPGVDFKTHSIGRDAVAPVVSSEVYEAGVRALGLEQIAAVYRGEIGNWKELGGPDRDILVVDKEPSRGTRHVFMKAVMGDKEAPAPGADLVLGSNNEEQTAIAQSDAAIGMLSLAWLNSDVKGLAIILADGSTVKPTLANILNGRFPITRALYVITNGEPRGQVKAFVDFLMSNKGQQIVRESGYVGMDG
ncbi:MAG: phosphate ABC transporter substrate-binding protein [Acidobacteriota bacterium]